MALAGLEPDDRHGLDVNQDMKQVLKELLEATEQKKMDCENRQWSYTTSNGNKRFIRDSVNTSLANLTKFIPVVDATVSSLPAIAAAPWGVFKFLLTVSAGRKKMLFE